MPEVESLSLPMNGIRALAAGQQIGAPTSNVVAPGCSGRSTGEFGAPPCCLDDEGREHRMAGHRFHELETAQDGGEGLAE